MPVQTTLTDYVYFPDSCKVEYKEDGAVSYTDLGAINGDVNAVYNYDVSEHEFANAGKAQTKIKNQSIEATITLANLNPVNIGKIGGGQFTVTTTNGTPTTDIPDQVIAANWNDNVKYELIMLTSSSDSTKLRTTAKPTLTSVTLDATSPETLTENNDYVIVADTGSYSGWSIQFISANMSTGTPKANTITIDYGSNIPVASTTVHCGSSSVVLTSGSLKFTHTDDFDLKRIMEIHSTDLQPGGIQIGYKSATSDGTEEMPLTIKGKINSTLTNGRQLFSWTIDNGAA